MVAMFFTGMVSGVLLIMVIKDLKRKIRRKIRKITRPRKVRNLW